ncbi:MAG: hypothetical protein HON53_16830 [Planctomycetaceae bacterium]|nr:hypothetical protein [Planctomycetaceae bacterium]MBT6155042.1 hypothetical protein [Planctomycetaceae bacterium]MBT6485718.1 hypothetical protein [Planctomycetaceae bacterium]MBT6496509.1 hypothetical protein [Planctomycetaceae bacterium]
MIEFDYLYKGLCGLANTHKVGALAGHLGAAVAAGYFFGEDQSDLPKGIYKGVEGELERVIRGEEAFWYNAKKAGVTPTELFKPFPKEQANEDSTKTVAAALQKNVGKTRQSGHNIIFATIALRALHDHAEYATPQIVAGVRKLVEGFNNAHPGRGYYGKAKGWLNGNQVKLQPDNKFRPYKSIAQMVDVTIAELISTAAVRKQGFGGLWHLINHAAAITELDRLGYEKVAAQALPAHHQHIRLWRSLPDVESELGSVVKSKRDPREPVYWEGMLKRDQARLTHRIKTLYGFYTIRRFVEDDATRKKAEDAFLNLMA